MYNSFLFFLGWLDCLSFWTCLYSSVLSFFVFILSTHLNKSLQKPLCGVKSLMCFCVCCYLSNRMTSEWSLSSKGRRGEALNEFTAAVWCSWHISLSSFCLWRILQFPRPIKLDDLKAKAKVAFGQTMDLHYTNNEVGDKKTAASRTARIELDIKNTLFLLLAVGDSVDHSGWPWQGSGAAGSKCSHEESEDPPGASESVSGQQIQLTHWCRVMKT